MQEYLTYNKIDTRFGKIGYIKAGIGQPLVMLSRYAATLYNWDTNLIKELTNHFTVYLIDLRLVGFSYSNYSNDIDGCVSDIIDGIEALELENPIVLGWSFGGIIIQQLYKRYRHNISGMVLLSSFPDPRLASTEFVELSMGLDKQLNDRDKVKLYQLMVSELPGTINYLKDFSLKIENYNYRYTKEAKELHNQFVLSSPSFTDADLKAISVPTLILNSKNDLSFPSSGHDRLFNFIPNSKLIIYPTGGHLLIHHHGAEIAADITTFFKRS